MIQKYTSGWPKYQKNIRVRPTSMPLVQPSDHGISSPISATTPSVAMIHMVIVQAAMKAGSGMRRPRLRALNQATLRKTSAATHHVPEHQEGRAEVEQRAGLERGVERVEHARAAVEDRDRGHRRAEQHHAVARPSPGESSAPAGWCGRWLYVNSPVMKNVVNTSAISTPCAVSMR